MKFQERNYANQTTNIRPTVAETPLSFRADLIARFRLDRTVALFSGCKVATYRCTLEKRRCLREICKSGESTIRGTEEGKIQRSERKRNEGSDERRRGEKRQRIGRFAMRNTSSPRNEESYFLRPPRFERRQILYLQRVSCLHRYFFLWFRSGVRYKFPPLSSTIGEISRKADDLL